MARSSTITLANFERAFDQMFKDLLTDRWQCGRMQAFERAALTDHGDRYEVIIAAPGVDPARVEVEVSSQRLDVRMPDRAGRMTGSAFSFESAVDAEAVTARWSEQTLRITLPKQKGARVEVK